uniref:FRIGIDA-like protein n=1 Tax=Steinernema glaseri TaxID=37863 RepID=A0A1I7ZFL1_9BILA
MSTRLKNAIESSIKWNFFVKYSRFRVESRFVFDQGKKTKKPFEYQVNFTRVVTRVVTRSASLVQRHSACPYTADASMSLHDLSKEISEHLEAIHDLSEMKPMPKIIQPHFKKVKEYFDQYVKSSEEYRQRCDELREVKERQERTIGDLRKCEERLTSELASKEQVIMELKKSGEELASKLASKEKTITSLEKKCAEIKVESDSGKGGSILLDNTTSVPMGFHIDHAINEMTIFA